MWGRGATEAEEGVKVEILRHRRLWSVRLAFFYCSHSISSLLARRLLTCVFLWCVFGMGGGVVRELCVSAAHCACICVSGLSAVCISVCGVHGRLRCKAGMVCVCGVGECDACVFSTRVVCVASVGIMWRMCGVCVVSLDMCGVCVSVHVCAMCMVCVRV